MKNTSNFAKSLLTLGAILTFAAPTFAQTPAPAAPNTPVKTAKHAGHLPKYLADVTLTPEQTEKVHAIQKTSAEQAKAVKTDATLTEDQKKAKLKDIKKDAKMQVMALLTLEQKEKVKEEHHDKKGAAPEAPVPVAPKA